MRRKLVIESPANTTFKRLKTLLTSKGIKLEGECLLSGEKIIHERLRNPGGSHLTIKSVISPVSRPTDLDLSTLGADVSEIEISDVLFRELDELGTHRSMLLIAVTPPPERELLAAPKGLELVCPVGDPQNLGAIARSAKAFGVERLLLTSESANPYLPKALKASSGALLDLQLARVPDLKTCIQSWASGPDTVGKIFGLDMDGVNLTDWTAPENFFLICGEEGQGLPDLPGIQKISIAMRGIESLNAAVASSIALHWLATR